MCDIKFMYKFQWKVLNLIHHTWPLPSQQATVYVLEPLVVPPTFQVRSITWLASPGSFWNWKQVSLIADGSWQPPHHVWLLYFSKPCMLQLPSTVCSWNFTYHTPQNTHLYLYLGKRPAEKEKISIQANTSDMGGAGGRGSNYKDSPSAQ